MTAALRSVNLLSGYPDRQTERHGLGPSPAVARAAPVTPRDLDGAMQRRAPRRTVDNASGCRARWQQIFGCEFVHNGSAVRPCPMVFLSKQRDY